MPLKFVHTNTVKEHHGKPIYCVTFNTYDPANQDLVASVGGAQATVYRCHPQGRLEVLQVYVDDHTQHLNGDATDKESFFCVKWSYDRSSRDPLLLLSGKLALIRVVNCTTGKAVATLKGHGKEVNDICVHPQHPHIILTASKDHSIRLWNITAGCCVLLMRGPGAHLGEVFTLDFHPWDPYLFVSGAMEGAVKVWSIKEHWCVISASEGWGDSRQQQRRAFPVRLVGHPVFSSRQVHHDYVDCCRWLGDLVLSKSTDYKIKLWRPLYPDNPILETSSKFEVLQVFDMPGDLMWWVRFSIDPYGRVLACGNTKGATYVWQPGLAKPHKGVALKHKKCTSVIRQTAVSMDGAIIISATEDAHLWRWDQQEQQQQQQRTSSSTRRAASKAAVAAAGAAAAGQLPCVRDSDSSSDEDEVQSEEHEEEAQGGDNAAAAAVAAAAAAGGSSRGVKQLQVKGSRGAAAAAAGKDTVGTEATKAPAPAAAGVSDGGRRDAAVAGAAAGGSTAAASGVDRARSHAGAAAAAAAAGRAGDDDQHVWIEDEEPMDVDEPQQQQQQRGLAAAAAAPAAAAALGPVRGRSTRRRNGGGTPRCPTSPQQQQQQQSGQQQQQQQQRRRQPPADGRGSSGAKASTPSDVIVISDSD